MGKKRRKVMKSVVPRFLSGNVPFDVNFKQTSGKRYITDLDVKDLMYHAGQHGKIDATFHFEDGPPVTLTLSLTEQALDEITKPEKPVQQELIGAPK